MPDPSFKIHHTGLWHYVNAAPVVFWVLRGWYFLFLFLFPFFSLAFSIPFFGPGVLLLIAGAIVSFFHQLTDLRRRQMLRFIRAWFAPKVRPARRWGPLLLALLGVIAVGESRGDWVSDLIAREQARTAKIIAARTTGPASMAIAKAPVTVPDYKVVLSPEKSAKPASRQSSLYRSIIARYAIQYRVPVALVEAVISQESGFDPWALSAKNAQGLMQLIPATARRFGVTNPWNPEQNIRGGTAYLSWLLDRFDGDLPLALAGYNAGENAVKRYQAIPPYRETRRYVERVMTLYGSAREKPVQSSAD
jgi:soluble lytic murein transglycosylase-like protein